MAKTQSLENQFNEARWLHQEQRLTEAEVIYRHLIPLSPKWAEIPHMLGVLLGQKGQAAEAASFLLKAIELQPTMPHYYHNLGRVYLTLRKWTESVSAFQFAIKLAPAYPEAWFGKGNALKGQGDFSAAIQAYQKSLKIKPDYSEALYNLSNTWLEMGHWRSARESYEKCLRLQPDHAQAHNNLASTLEYWEDYELAEVHYLRAIQLSSGFLEAKTNLASLYEKEGRSDECRNIMSKLLQNFSGHPQQQWWNWHYHQISEIIWQDLQQIMTYRQKLLDQVQDYTTHAPQMVLADLHRLQVQPPFDLAYQGLDDLSLKIAYARFFDRYFEQIRKELGTHAARPLKASRRKVGFVVTQGHEGVFLKCMLGMLQKLDTSILDITVICQAPNGQAILQPVIDRKDISYLPVPGRLDLAIHLLQEARFDILHYWEVGTDALNYFLPFFHLAPVQCTSWGWPVTSGIPTMDYFLSCDLLETEDSEQYYSEKLIRFHRLPVYYYRPRVPVELKDRVGLGLPTNKRLYLCAQNLRKVHPDMDTLVKGILQADADALVLFLADKQKAITNKLRIRLEKALGQEAPRCVFLPRMKEEDYLNLLCLVEVILDTPHYTGGANTAYDAFATGTPYVTLPTQYHRGRYGMAAYRQLGLMDLIANSPEEYVLKAVKVANDRSYRAQLRERIMTGHQNIFEDELAVQELQDFLQNVLPPD